MNQLKKKSTSPQRANDKGFIYIQAGALKGKKLEVITAKGLRPIGSRVKETFFNWIQFEVQGKDCLDLFSGSGSLGFEALSRGCRSLQMYEFNKAVYDRLIMNYRGLNLSQCELHFGVMPEVNIALTDSYRKVEQAATKSYNLVFVDPPFMEEKELQVLHNLANHGYLQEQAVIFLQLDGAYKHLVTQLDQRFTIRKQKSLGNILVYLLDYQAEGFEANSQTASSTQAEFDQLFEVV